MGLLFCSLGPVLQVLLADRGQRDRILIKGHNGHFLVNTVIWQQHLIERKWSYLAVKRFMTRSMPSQRLQIVNKRIGCIFQSSWLWDLFCKIFLQHAPPPQQLKWRRGNYLGENVNYVQIFTYISLKRLKEF
ncbi:hypothetical protein LXL04_024742 [Taraxacum kok-saghyz]